MQRGKRRALLDGELVERQMLACEVERLAEFGAPRVDALAGSGINQIEGEALERATRDVDRRAGFLRRMQAAERAQLRIVERLHAERDTIDAGRAIAAKTSGLDARRIGFESDLCARLHCPMPANGVENGADRMCAHQRRRAATEENAGHRAAGCKRHPVLQLLQESGKKSCFVDAADAHMAVEVAVGALGGAERPMHVDAEAGLVSRVCESRHAATNLAKARAR